MRWTNVKWILLREVRDQLRDRRTLFMIGVLPLLLYPLIGVTFLQVVQFLRDHPSRVLVTGASQLPDHPALLKGNAFSDQLYATPKERLLFQLTFDKSPAVLDMVRVQEDLESGRYDAVVHFPAGSAKPRSHHPAVKDEVDVAVFPQPQIYYNAAKDKSRIAYERLLRILTRWRQSIAGQSFPVQTSRPSEPNLFEVSATDVAVPSGRRAIVWSKVLPFVLIIWALTGAFYPAIDLCAGEKERGTLETLLSSPAERSEIVFGKLLTIMLFSMATAVLNLACMMVIATLILHQLSSHLAPHGELAIGPPPLSVVGWLLVALIPLSAMFSAISLALAAMARSTKEGQYYLLPLLLVAMPLLIVPMLPTAELDLGTSLVPVTGLMLLLRKLMEGEHIAVLAFAAPTLAVTLTCCWLAIRWAVAQFNDESVLFRESERVDLRLWLVHVLRDRRDKPSVGAALSCGLLILMIRFFGSMFIPTPDSWQALAGITVITMIGLIAAPAILLSVMLTRDPAASLGLNRPPAWSVTGAMALAVCLHPAAVAVTGIVQRVYPSNDEAVALLERLISPATAPLQMLLVLAVLPAVCEELAFRGFILSGLQRWPGHWRAIIVCSLFFGLAHGMLQQSVMATLLGLLIGYVAIQSGSVLPCIAFHAVHNALLVLVAQLLPPLRPARSPWDWLISNGDQGYYFHWTLVAASCLSCGLLLRWFHHLPRTRTRSGHRQRALHQPATSVATR